MRQPHNRLPVIIQSGIRLLTRNQNQVQPRRHFVLREPKRLTQQPLQPHPHDGVSVFPGHTDSQPSPAAIVPGGKDEQVLVPGSLPLRINAIEIGGFTEMAAPGKSICFHGFSALSSFGSACA